MDTFRNCEAWLSCLHIRENFGIVVAEAMAAGRPVLISNKVNIWREVETCGGGLIAVKRARPDGILASFFALT